jgi:hypothetical protein
MRGIGRSPKLLTQCLRTCSRGSKAAGRLGHLRPETLSDQSSPRRRDALPLASWEKPCPEFSPEALEVRATQRFTCFHIAELASAPLLRKSIYIYLSEADCCSWIAIIGTSVRPMAMWLPSVSALVNRPWCHRSERKCDAVAPFFDFKRTFDVCPPNT